MILKISIINWYLQIFPKSMILFYSLLLGINDLCYAKVLKFVLYFNLLFIYYIKNYMYKVKGFVRKTSILYYLQKCLKLIDFSIKLTYWFFVESVIYFFNVYKKKKIITKMLKIKIKNQELCAAKRLN